jgi:hypothetical protein
MKNGVRTPSDVREPFGSRRSPLEAWVLVPPRGVRQTGVKRQGELPGQGGQAELAKNRPRNPVALFSVRKRGQQMFVGQVYGESTAIWEGRQIVTAVCAWDDLNNLDVASCL